MHLCNIYTVMASNARHLNSIVNDLKAFLETYDGTQQELAKSTGVSQSTISRLSEPATKKNLSKGIKQLCKYANISLTEVVNALNPDPCSNTDLVAALREVWDGTPAHAKALAKVIRDLKHLRQT